MAWKTTTAPRYHAFGVTVKGHGAWTEKLPDASVPPAKTLEEIAA
jgi:hypothetical protein